MTPLRTLPVSPRRAASGPTAFGPVALLLGQLLALLLTLLTSVGNARAAEIDLRLDVDYAGGLPSAGGAWTLYARTDEFGLFSLDVTLRNIGASVTNELPVGRVNGSATNNAGFSTFVNLNLGTSRELFFGQQVTTSGEGQQGVFYGVGTIDNGSPNYPGKPGGTTSLGPSITTLTNVQNVPWGDDPMWSTGVAVASGVFSAGLSPSFSTINAPEGSVFTSVGTIDTPGATTLDIDFTTLVVTNLDFGVATGDYNDDGVVDAADYTVWRDALGQSVTPLTGADGNGDGLVNTADHQVWANNYGATAPSSAVAVPEPASAVLGATLLLASLGARRPAECR